MCRYNMNYALLELLQNFEVWLGKRHKSRLSKEA